MTPIGNWTCNLLACSTVPQPAAPLPSPEKYIQVCNQQIALIKHLYMCPLFVYSHLQGISILVRHLQLLCSLSRASGKIYNNCRPLKLPCIVLYKNVKLLLLLLLSSSSSSSPLSLLSSLCRVFTIIYLKQTMFLGYTVLQLSCIYYLCCM